MRYSIFRGGEVTPESTKMAVDLGDHIDNVAFSQILELDESPQNREFSRALVYDYFTQAKDTFENMDKALSERNLLTLSELGHFLKGSSAALGFSSVRDHCQAIQQYGKKMSLDGSPEPDENLCLERITDALSAAKSNMALVEVQMNEFFGSE